MSFHNTATKYLPYSRLAFLYFILWILNPYISHAQYFINLEDQNSISLEKRPRVFEAQADLSFKEIRTLDKDKFQEYSTIQFSEEKTYWGYFTLTNTDPHRSSYILNVGWNNSFVSIFYGAGNTFIEKRTGSYEKMSLRDIADSRVQAVNIQLPYNEEVEVYVKFHTFNNRLPGLMQPKVLKPAALYSDLNQRDHFQFLFQGILWVMILYNFLIYLYSKDKAYLNYSLYMFCVAAYFLYYNGYSKKYFFPESYWAEDYLWIISTGLTSVFYYYFMRYFLDTGKLIPKVNQLLQYWIYIRLGLLAFCLFLLMVRQIPILNQTTIILGAFEALFGIYIFIKLLLTKNKLARFFVVGGMAFTLGTFAGMISYSYSPFLYAFFY